MPDSRDQRTREAYTDTVQLSHVIDLVSMLSKSGRQETMSHAALVDVLHYLRVLDRIWSQGANDASDQSQEG